jgi:hypothetical protein
MSTGGAKPVVVNASSGPAGGLYNSRKRRFIWSGRLEELRKGSERVNTVIKLPLFQRYAKRRQLQMG